MERIVIGAFLSLGMIGCGVADIYMPVSAEGTVVDAKSGEPIEGAEVFFIDYGLDAWRPKPYRLSVGRTDKRGRFDVEFRYLYGRRIPKLWHDSKGKYGFEVVKAGYKRQAWRAAGSHEEDIHVSMTAKSSDS